MVVHDYSVMVTIWWLAFFVTLGLCLGSFLNVVVYRLPRGLAISRPRWSFCPHCQKRIAWYDNIPVLSYVRLRGRCRNCEGVISPRYVLMEVMAAMAVVVLFDAFFIAHVRDGLFGGEYADLTWRLSEDWPIFLAHVILFVSLMAMSAIDIQNYWVDIRFTHFAALCGLLLHAIWTPRHSVAWPRPFDGTILATTVGLAVFAVTLLIMYLMRQQPIPDDGIGGDEEPAAAPEGSPAGAAGMRMALWPLLVLGFLVLTAGGAALGVDAVSFGTRAWVALFFFFGVILYEASHVRAADREIVEAIESEAPGVRREALVELAVLAPGALLGGGALWYAAGNAAAADWVPRVLHWAPLGGAWQPLWGMGTGVTGYVIASVVGWSIRIVANLVWGKEAFATGDIHMMAAAGCVLGWPVALLGFMLTCFVAVGAWVALLPFKKTRAIPLGPWLWMGFFTATVFHKYLSSTQVVRNVVEVADLLFFRNSQHILFR